MNGYGKHQDMEQFDEYERELAEQMNLLNALDRLMTPEHIAGRFQELLQAAAGDGLIAGARPSGLALPVDDHSLCLRLAVPAVVGSRDVSRIADRAAATSEWLALPGRDLRMMNADGRAEIKAVLTNLRELLRCCPAGAFDVQTSAMILTTAAGLAEALIANREERTALHLIRAAVPHLALLGRRHPAAFEIRRAHATALCELGYYEQAESLLWRQREDEKQVFGADNPWTELLLAWAQVGSGKLRQAEAGFRALKERLDQSGESSPYIRRHVQCREAWLYGQMGRDGEAEEGYDFVIAQRSSELDYDHADTLDARHSKGKMLVLAGDGHQAAKVLEPLIEERMHVLGADHPDTLETRKYLYLSWVLMEPRDKRILGRAKQELSEIHRIQASRNGPDHPMSRDTAAQLWQIRGLRLAVEFREPTPDLRQIPVQDGEPSQAPLHAPPQRSPILREAVRQ